MFKLILYLLGRFCAVHCQRVTTHGMTYRKTKRHLPIGLEKTLQSALLQIATPGDHLHKILENPRSVCSVIYRGDGNEFSRKDGDAYVTVFPPGHNSCRLPVMSPELQVLYSKPPLNSGIPRVVFFYLVNPTLKQGDHQLIGFGCISLVHCALQLAWYPDGEFADLIVVTDPRQHGSDEEMEAMSSELINSLREEKVLMEVLPMHVSHVVP